MATGCFFQSITSTKIWNTCLEQESSIHKSQHQIVADLGNNLSTRKIISTMTIGFINIKMYGMDTMEHNFDKSNIKRIYFGQTKQCFSFPCPSGFPSLTEYIQQFMYFYTIFSYHTLPNKKTCTLFFEKWNEGGGGEKKIFP